MQTITSPSSSSSSSSSSTSFHLLSLLLKCAELISTNHPTLATDLLPELSELSSPFGTPFHRVAAYFTHSLRHHLLLRHLPLPPSNSPLRSLCLSLNLPTFHSALHSFNSLTPFIKFSHFTSNQAIFRAALGHPRLHIIDLDIMQGLQWPALFHILSSSTSSCSPSIKVTAFGPSSTLLAQTGVRLAEFAQSLGLPFQYHPIEGKIGNTTSNFLQKCHVDEEEEDEVRVVHCMQHRLYDVVGCSAGEMMKVLRVVRPTLVTVVEQDLEVTSHSHRHNNNNNNNCGWFLDKFVDALHYYSALFDAVGEGLLGKDTLQRYQVEHQLFGTEINNILALDGRIINGCHDHENYDRRVTGKWAQDLVRAGFEPFSLSGSPAAQAGLLLEMFPWKGYTLIEQNGSLRLGWKDLPLLTASAWQPTFF